MATDVCGGVCVCPATEAPDTIAPVHLRHLALEGQRQQAAARVSLGAAPFAALLLGSVRASGACESRASWEARRPPPPRSCSRSAGARPWTHSIPAAAPSAIAPSSGQLATVVRLIFSRTN
jgi:hypothetical protein